MHDDNDNNNNNNDYMKEAQLSFKGRMSYGDYLQLDKILSAQHPLSDADDELLFIIQHQTSELWMNLALYELRYARNAIAQDGVHHAMKSLARVSRIFEQLNSAWDVLRTMTPSDYTRFREALGQSSGFQSYQYRMIEFILGNRNEVMIRPHAHHPEIVEILEKEMHSLSLYDEVLEFARRSGHDIPQRQAQSRACIVDDKVTLFWQKIYQDSEAHWKLYEIAEKLVDLEDYFRRWRFNHLTTVERVIGLKKGTGGTSGAAYLKKMLETELFPELWLVRTML